MNRRQRRATARKRGQDTRQTRGSGSIDSKLKASVSAHPAGRLTEAKRLYAEVLSREPENITALNLLGVVMHQEGDALQAAELIEKALILKPDYAEAHYNLGIVLTDQGRLEDAVAAYQKALELRPDYTVAHDWALPSGTKAGWRRRWQPTGKPWSSSPSTPCRTAT